VSRALTITQCTEVGTVYGPDEVGAVCDLARRYNLRVHMDGARFANAAAHLDVRPAELTWKAGVDVLCFGGTKMGMPVGDAVVFFDRDLAWEFDYRCKQAGQLASKMRFLAAPWTGMLADDAWLRHARHANAMAALMERRIGGIDRVRILFPREATSVFAAIPAPMQVAMHERGWRFYNVVSAGGARLMHSWDTTDEDVEAFAADLRDLSTADLSHIDADLTAISH